MPIQVLLVDDSPVVLMILKRLLDSSSEVEVVGTARSGREALALIPEIRPQVICTDLQMPGMDGLELIREVMANYPCPILVLSAGVQTKDTQNVFRLLEAGAVDVLPKPLSGSTSDLIAIKKELISKIKVLAGVAVFTLHRHSYNRFQLQKLSYKKELNLPGFSASASGNSEVRSASLGSSSIELVGIGASTGGPQALKSVLSELPDNFPVPVICIQHISPGFLTGLVDWLASECRLSVSVAKMGEIIQPGCIYFPPENRHLEVTAGGRVICSLEPPCLGHRPSVTVTFNSIAKSYGKKSMGVLLTGMGQDGALGMQSIAKAGGITIAQNEATSTVFGMPKAAIDLGTVRHILPIQAIGDVVIRSILKKT